MHDWLSNSLAAVNGCMLVYVCVYVCAHLRLVKVYGINILIEIENAPQLK